ncbi:glycoside hydrolase family 9 protein [Asticcacaulis endophyticus]|uniref:Endoglucanase n=1 Tax=Asticcacaulis endophyticus TaxID=1395890 RepID=A0A918QDF6_9CAUL|nr:glycoside hydrolase family 9 protein [Asticcacaulis endophyticus]GGZ42581.1 endoglucanase [Asticcacaulis endophyticus]
MAKRVLKPVIGMGLALMVSACAGFYGGGAVGESGPQIALNQTGFLPSSPKIAIVSGSDAKPVPWQVKDAKGKVVARGQSRYFGMNAGSGSPVHQIDFSELKTVGKDYVLVFNQIASSPFDIGPKVYDRLRYDTLAFFYHQRASVPIEAKYVGERWARPVAHNPDTATCYGPKDFRGNDWGGCPYTLDVSKGWYDAGDQGKYVVNGGIAVWTLMNWYEFSKGAADFADGKVAIPENANGINDLLDEVRFEMDFMMAMQVPDGATLKLPRGNQMKSLDKLEFSTVDASGMAHHKMHDEHWTAVPMPPHLDTEKRYLSYPSTTATLNLAASAAQCARLFKGVDGAYAAKCLTSARRAFAAAQRLPDVLAIDVLQGGGGGYGDPKATDEFYWAAAELFITTGEAEFEAFVRASPDYLASPSGDAQGGGDISWGSVQALGTLSLSIAPNIPADMRDGARQAIIKTADAYVAQTAGEGYMIPMTRPYVWGSNADFANRAMIFGYAHSFTKNQNYFDQSLHLMDYLLGRNPNMISYVSGYGLNAMQHPHHRFWAPSKDKNLPPPPPGVLAGGPQNRNAADPALKAIFANCKPQTCYIDHIDSYSTNEVAINWNAPLFWLAAYVGKGTE